MKLDSVKPSINKKDKAYEFPGGFFLMHAQCSYIDIR